MDGPVTKDQKLVLDSLAWIFNVTTSVGIIMVNKALQPLRAGC